MFDIEECEYHTGVYFLFSLWFIWLPSWITKIWMKSYSSNLHDYRARMIRYGLWGVHPFACEIFGGLVQDCSISIANALEILQSCTKPSYYSVYANHQTAERTGAVKFGSNLVTFYENAHNTHRIAHPIGQAMTSLLWVESQCWF